MPASEWLRPGLCGAACGAIALSIVGFYALGWQTARSSEQMASDRADAAVVTALLPFCVAKANADPDASRLVKLKAEQSEYSRTDMVLKAGWATFNDAKLGDSALGHACAVRLNMPVTG